MQRKQPGFPSIEDIKAYRQRLRDDSRYSGNLKQGTTLSPFDVSPYSFTDTLRYLSRLMFHRWFAATDLNEVKRRVNQSSNQHVIGMRTAKFHSTTPREIKGEEAQGPTILFAGDVMVSESGESIVLTPSFLDQLKKANAIVINIESPVSFSMTLVGRDGIRFEMTQAYLQAIIKQIKDANPNIQIIYDIANNHALDAQFNPQTSGQKEKTIHEVDPENFSLHRTIDAIEAIDKNAMIIGTHLRDHHIAVIEKNDVRIGLVGFTDVLNHNDKNWKTAVIRTEDCTADVIAGLKEKYDVDQLYFVGHANIEQYCYPSAHGRALVSKLLQDGADGFIGHGPHVPYSSEVLIGQNGKSHLVVPSVGNFFGPKHLQQTGVNSLAQITIHRTQTGLLETDFIVEPIEAYVENGLPIVSMSTAETTHYPHLLSRFTTQCPNRAVIQKDNKLQIQSLTEVEVKNLSSTKQLLQKIQDDIMDRKWELGLLGGINVSLKNEENVIKARVTATANKLLETIETFQNTPFPQASDASVCLDKIVSICHDSAHSSNAYRFFHQQYLSSRERYNNYQGWVSDFMTSNQQELTQTIELKPSL
jgi:poly-gamma-glutamate capsule biosynthesis protein CapA/YwtB (metallophosphatase superfamily)